MKKNKKLFLQLCFLFILTNSIFAKKTERLDVVKGFREFEFKTTKDRYLANFQMHKTDYYGWPEILQVYTLKYNVQLAGTKTDSLHLFFLGNNLVRTLVFTTDTTNINYLEKNFGESLPINDPKMNDEQALLFLKKQHRRYSFSINNRWDADMVRMETKWMYQRFGKTLNQNIKKTFCIDFYLKDFEDMMNALE